jgi:alpha-tubulin suppressor-like RCC1 family protein
MRRFGSAALAIGLAVSVLAVAPAQAAPALAAPPGAFTAVSPARVLDTRLGGPIGPGRTVTLDLSGAVPVSTTSVVLNVTGTMPTEATFVTAYPAGAARPTASNVNLVAGETRPNLVTVAVGAGRKVVLYNNAGSIHLIADLAGFYASETAAATGRFTAFTPIRAMDTRVFTGPRPPGPVGPGVVETLDLSDRVPVSATAVTFNLTGTGATDATFVTAWPAGAPRPTASNLNLTVGATTPNQVVVALGADRKVNLYNKNGNAHLIADVAGFYTPDYGALFTPVSPTRVLDTRNGAAVGPEQRIDLGLGTIVPQHTTGVVLNLTGTQGSAGTYVTSWPPPEPQPFSSNLNLARGRTAANLAVVGVGTNASVTLYNKAGRVHLIADLAGYFSLPPVTCASRCVLAWGSNEYGAAGTGGYNPGSATPTNVYGLSDVVAVAGGAGSGYALKSDGTVWAWGVNFSGELGNGWYGVKSVVPVPVIGLTGIVAIDPSIALKNDGTVWTWGQAPSGGFTTPGQVPDLTDVTAVAAGFGVVYALKSDGTVWSWGSNGFGALGIGAPDNADAAEPVQVPGLTGVRQLAAGMYGASALKDDGTIWSWGDNRQGQLGNGTIGGTGCGTIPPTPPNCSSNVPVKVVNLTGATWIAADGNHGFAVLGDGTAWSWGSNYNGALGTGQDCDTCWTGTPAKITGLTTAKTIAGNSSGGYITDTDGHLWAWGDNYRSALGPVANPAIPYSTVPLRLQTPTATTTITGGMRTGFALVP